MVKKKKSLNVYDMVTERIMEQLKEGIIPWNKPWTGIKGGAFNRITKHPYSLLNQLLLRHAGEYATLKQWSELGGKIKKGEKSEIIVFWKIFSKMEETEEGEQKPVQIPLLRYYNVFHISQVENVEALENSQLPTNNPIEKAENVLHNYWDKEHIKVEHIASDEAYYSPNKDIIHLPLFEQFNSEKEYYSTAFHESVHSTMVADRCNREEESRDFFGTEKYSKEELIAEIGAASLMNFVGIETDRTFQNSVAYIQSWLQVLKNDNKFIVSASSKAEKAVEFILNEEGE